MQHGDEMDSDQGGNPKFLKSMVFVILLALVPAQAQSAPGQAAAAPLPGTADPFITGTLGILPFVSGFYLTRKPEKGLIFTLVDAMLVLAIFNARKGRQQDEHNANIYYGLIALNNVADAGLSILQATREHPAAARITLQPEGGIEAGLAWNF
jgi:hypothetical protein